MERKRGVFIFMHTFKVTWLVTKVSLQFSEERIALSIFIVGKGGYLGRKKNLDSYLRLFITFKSKWTLDEKVKPEKIKFLE